jgi:hypothetical protein
MGGTVRHCLIPTVIVLMLCAVPAVAAAEQFVCWPITRGDTAASLARRLTGSAAAVHGPTFQIRNPARRMFVPKSQYQRLSTDWQACVAAKPANTTGPAYAAGPSTTASAIVPEEPAITSAPLAASSAPPALIQAKTTGADGASAAAIAATCMLILMMSAGVAGVLVERPIPPPMQRAGEAFVTVFARPLRDLSSDAPPIRTRFRFVRRKQQLEISIAPGPGRRYPNLADHRTNVEYDVNRVMRVLGNHLVQSDRLRAAGKWVVVPVRLADAKPTGAK